MGKRREQRTRIALPVKVQVRDAQNRPITQVACTMDITPKGARLTGVRGVSEPGEILCVERGKNKAYYRVTWIGARKDGTEGQVGLECVEPGAAIWGMDLMPGKDERYDSMPAAPAVSGPLAEKKRTAG